MNFDNKFIGIADLSFSRPPANPVDATAGGGDDDFPTFQTYWSLREDGGYGLRESGDLEQREN